LHKLDYAALGLADFGRPVPACLFEALEPAVTAPNLSAEKISPAGEKAGLLAAAALQIFSLPRSSALLRPLAQLAVIAAPYAGSMRETSQGTVPAHQPKETRHG